ncbi:unnamed protein product [Macrosiphum euphorbiae]|uniref:Uncharacterized protein n=1 Tax=Macrosiphum euphorbiae TaxID=13131 RepID=A0AAV0X8K5_9HEMI|nr:unnamed protein product [Macrosiphum euphorbiae]
MDNNDLDGVNEDLADFNIQSTSTSETAEEFNVNDAVEDLGIFFSYLTELLELMAGIDTNEKFNDVRSKLITGETTYPPCFKHIVTKYFKLLPKPKKKGYTLIGKEISDYLKQFLKVNNNNNILTDHPSLEDDVTYDELITFIKSCKSTISNDDQKALKKKMYLWVFLRKISYRTSV